eukprot:TRINITY_DN559_c0_g1_i2.p3 TRINITY_DN559_c0_g1~~TRINITY_DN559_c0_g1_i2.p3  ORF type:complete len:100 (+),score=30.50 TRINITY_DN559_c0_g1_i2:56-355(+)
MCLRSCCCGCCVVSRFAKGFTGARRVALVGVSAVAAAGATLPWSAMSCVDDVLRLGSDSKLRKALVHEVFHWNPGLHQQVFGDDDDSGGAVGGPTTTTP